MTALVWFRHDLRTLDNTALTEAARQGPVRGVYFLCPQQLDEHVAVAVYFLVAVALCFIARPADSLGL